MAHQREYLTGLDRELELFMGGEYETPKGVSISVLDPAGSPMFFQFGGFLSDQDKRTTIHISEHTYKKGTGATAKTYRVPGVTQIFAGLSKRGDTSILGLMDFLQFNENYDPSRPESNTNPRFNVVRQNATTQFEIVESRKVFTMYVSPVGGLREYPLGEPVENQIRAFREFVKNSPVPPAEQKFLEENEFHPQEGLEPEYEKIEPPTPVPIGIEDLQEGDIIVSTTRYPLSKFIRVLSGSKVSHTAMYIGNGEVVEAIGGAVKRHSVEEAIKDDKYAYALRYPNLNLGAQGVITGFGIKHAKLATPFDGWGMVFRAGLRIPGGGDERFYCSEMVLKAYETAGIPLFTTTQKRPGDIDELRGTKLQYAGHLKLTKRQLRKLGDEASELPAVDDDEEEVFELEDIEDDSEYADDLEDAPEDDDEEFEFEDEPDDFEYEDDGVTENFARRLHELSTRSFESEYELNEELDRALDAVENEFFVQRLRRKRKRGKRKGLFKKILSTGAKIVGKVVGKTPIGSLIKAGTSLVRGNIKGALGNLAKAAVGTALGPVAGTVATTAIDALGAGGEEGGEEGEIRRGGRRRKAMRRVARIARDTYREVADTLPENFDHPLVASEVAGKAVRTAMIKNGVKPPGRTGDAPPERRRRVIRLEPGERVVIISS
jgi:Permuted papain-like amidase enzyme, YaeF/YiiX, C92 family